MIDRKKVKNSATGMASHTPVIPSRFGRVSRESRINTKVLQKEIIAEFLPSDKAVNSDEEYTLNPINR